MDDVERVAVCVACGGERFATLPVPEHWHEAAELARMRGALGLCCCRSCGLVFANPRPAAALLARFYRGIRCECHRPRCTDADDRVARVQLDFVARVARAHPRLLDFGCGSGYLLRNALARGWDAIGYDIGEQPLAECRRQGLPVTDRLAALADHFFDAIYLSHVFEHLPDPAAALAELAALLAPGGRLVIEVPNARSLRARLSPPLLARWLGFDERYRGFPIHLYYYSTSSLRRVLARHGLVSVAHTTSGFGLDDLIVHEQTGEPTMPAAPRTRSPRLKRGFYRLGLGENLVVAATARA